jgi:hypothetical protein
MTTTSNLKTGVNQLISELKYETDKYFLQIGYTIGLAKKGTPVYQIVNKEHGIIEGESISLVDAIGTLVGRTEALKQYEEALSSGVAIGPNIGTGEVH